MDESFIVYVALVALIALGGVCIWLLTRLDLLEDGMEYEDERGWK